MNSNRQILTTRKHIDQTSGRKANASLRVGCPAVPPADCVDSAPHTHPIRSDFSSDHPFKYPYKNPASKLSPAPTVSITFTGMEATLTFPPFLTPKAPSAPNLIPSVSTLDPSLSAAKSTLDSPESDIASFSFGRSTSVTGKSSSKPVHISEGS